MDKKTNVKTENTQDELNHLSSNIVCLVMTCVFSVFIGTAIYYLFITDKYVSSMVFSCEFVANLVPCIMITVVIQIIVYCVKMNNMENEKNAAQCDVHDKQSVHEPVIYAPLKKYDSINDPSSPGFYMNQNRTYGRYGE